MPVIVPNLLEFQSYEEATLTDIVKRIRTDNTILLNIEKLRAMKPDEQKRYKINSLPAFSLSEFKENTSILNKNFIQTEYLLYDVDDINKTQIRQIETKLKEFALFWFVSPRGQGIKFVIQMKEPVTPEYYESTYMYYLKYFEGILDCKLDEATKDLRRLTLFSYYATCELNPNFAEYDVIRQKIERKKSDIDVSKINDDELREIAQFLSTKKLAFPEWFIVGMALKSIDRKDLYMLIGQGDTDEDHTHRNWDKTWDTYRPTSIGIGSLFHVAQRFGYERKHEYIRSSSYGDFDIMEDGMYQKGQRQFGFRKVEVLYHAKNEDGTHDICISLDGVQLRIPHKAFANPMDIRKNILNQHPHKPFMTLSGAKPYEELLKMIDKLDERRELISCEGVGRVAPFLWNFGNMIYFKGKTFEWNEIVNEETDNVGYVLSRRTDVEVVPTRDLKHMLKLFPKYYGQNTALMLGWAVGNLFYEEIIENYKLFPILFFHGATGLGKTQAAVTTLSLFGVKPTAMSKYKTNLGTKSTQNAIQRDKSSICGIPTIMDEYNDNYYDLIKAFFDGDSKHSALKTNDLQTKQLKVKGGTIFCSVAESSQPEAINRCVNVNCNTFNKSNSGGFQRDIFDNLNKLSSFAILCIIGFTWDMWKDAYKKALSQFQDFCMEGDSRIIQNYAMCYAGYKLLVEKGFCDEISDNWWYTQVIKRTEATASQSPVELIMEMINNMVEKAEDRDERLWFVDREDDAEFNGRMCKWYRFNASAALAEVKEKDNRSFKIINVTVREFIDLLAVYDLCIENGVNKSMLRAPNDKGCGKWITRKTWLVGYPVENRNEARERKNKAPLPEVEINAYPEDGVGDFRDQF